MTRKGPKPVPVLDRFWASFEVGDSDQCWVWQGNLDQHGYGRVFLGRPGGRSQTMQAHAFSYVVTHGVQLAGLACHHCDNPPCVNPQHIYDGSPAENSADMVRRGRSVIGERNGQAKLTVAQMLEVASSTERGSVLARQYAVSPQTICDIRHGRRAATR